MSRRNNVRGPTSALTEFLKESGITPTTVARRVRTREVAQPVAGPSTVQEDDEDENDEPAPTRDADDYSSDNLDDTDTEKAPPKKRVKLSKAAEAKLKAEEKKKAKAKARKKKGADDDDYSDSEEDDPYTALSKMWKDPEKPPVGSFIPCAKCKKKFTVTKYTVATRPKGFLCHPCAKSAGPDPFKKPALPRKRKPLTEKRNVQHFEERRLASLTSMCVHVISQHINDVEALGDISAMNAEEIAKAIAKNRSLTPENATLFYGVENTKLTLYDATNLTPPALCTLAMLNPNLTTIRLDFCGRMDSAVIEAWSTGLPNLIHLDLLGPFLVRTKGWQTFFESHPNLETFQITQSPRFNLDCMQSLVENCTKLTKLRLKEIGLMSDDFLPHIATLGGQLTHLDISRPGVPDVLSEDAVITLLEAIGGGLTHLDLSGNLQLGDGLLFHGLKPHARRLASLILTDLIELSDAGVFEFFDTWADAASPPNPPLMSVDISRCHELSGKALEALLEHSGKGLEVLNINGWKAVPQDSLMKIGQTAHALRRLDIGWCREVDDFVIKEVVDKCPDIEEIKVYGCQRLTDRCPRKRNVNIRGVETHTIH